VQIAGRSQAGKTRADDRNVNQTVAIRHLIVPLLISHHGVMIFISSIGSEQVWSSASARFRVATTFT
jgi:hypothetical protein